MTASAVTAMVATALALSACGSSTGSAASTSATSMMSQTSSMPMSSSASAGSSTGSSSGSAMSMHNAADGTFATAMIPHHQQAVEMAQLAATRAKSEQVKSLAATIAGEQSPEISMMNGWLKGWGMPMMSSGSNSQMSGMGDGMMTTADMTALKGMSGSAFDKRWLTMMVQHHRGAIAMARTELSSGGNASAKKLAGAIITGQSSEVSTMTALMSSMTGSG